MRQILILTSLLALLTGCGPKTKTPPPVESPKDALVKQLFSYVENGQIAYGHQDDLVYGHSWVVSDVENDTLERSDVRAVTGKYPMVVGFDLGGIEMGDKANLDSVDFNLMRRAVQTHIARGGIVTFSWHPRNPLTGGDAWDISSKEVVASVLERGEKHDEFVVWLRRAADFIESLGDVAVIFRPWHENLGSWFWWGRDLCSEEQYRELFRMTHRYFTMERHLDNILWCYSPNGPIHPKDYMSRYPGDECVDILGTDIYEYPGDMKLEDAGVFFCEHVKDMLTALTSIAKDHEKLTCFSETGLEGIPDPHWWTSVLLPAIQDFPITYVLTWRNAHDKPGHFYAPWEGFVGADDFRAFAKNEKTVFLNL